MVWEYDAGVVGDYCPGLLGSWGFRWKVVSIDEVSGAPKWEFALADYPDATNCCLGGEETIYFGAGGKLYALRVDGTFKWSFDMGSRVDDPAVGVDGAVYAGSTVGRRVALSADGKLKWGHSIRGHQGLSFDMSGNLYCPASPCVMYSFTKEGRLRWTFKLEGNLPVYQGMHDWANTLDAPSIADDSTIYAGSMLSMGFTKTGQQIQVTQYLRKPSSMRSRQTG